jgi:hypothetical protein
MNLSSFCFDYSSVNVQCCYNEFVVLRREFENEFYQNQKDLHMKTTTASNQNGLQNTTEPLESTRIDNDDKICTEEKDSDQLPDYSVYDDDVNASILRVLRDEEPVEDETLTEEVILLFEVKTFSLIQLRQQQKQQKIHQCLLKYRMIQ